MPPWRDLTEKRSGARMILGHTIVEIIITGLGNTPPFAPVFVMQWISARLTGYAADYSKTSHKFSSPSSSDISFALVSPSAAAHPIRVVQNAMDLSSKAVAVPGTDGSAAIEAVEALSSVENSSPPVSEEASSMLSEKGKGEDLEQAKGPGRVWFDILSNRALRNIVKNISKYPRRPDWAGYLEAEDALTLYTLGGKLSDETKRMFPHISVWRYFAQNADRENYPYDPDELCLNEQSENSETVARILLEADHHSSLFALQHLPTAPLASRVWTNLSSRLEPLRALHLLGSSDANLFDSILAAIGPSLTSLGARCDERAFVNSIAARCTRLTDLTLYERHGNLEAIWRTVGRNLRYLKIEQHIRNEVELIAIKTNCRKIVKLDVYARWEERELNQTVAELYASYGRELLFANLFTMEPTDCSKVIDSCPNVQCAASFTEFAEEGLLVKEGLEALGPALIVAVISFGDDDVYFHGMDDAATSCHNLRELTMKELDLNAEMIISAIFSQPKFKLRVVSISGVKQNSKNCLDIISHTTGALTKFSYCGYMTSMHTQMGIRVLVACNPNLEEIDLKLQGPEIVAPEDIYSSTSEEGGRSSRCRQTYTDTYPGLMNPNGSFVDTSPGYSAEDFINSDIDSGGGSKSQRPAEEISLWEQEEKELANGLRRSSASERNSRIRDRNRAYAKRYGHNFYGGCEDHNLDRTPVPSELDLAQFVSSVKMATNLRNLSIQIPEHLIPEPPRPYESVANACVHFRNRRVHVCIGGIYYLE